MMLRRFATIATAGFSAFAGCSDPAPLPVDAALFIEMTTCDTSVQAPQFFVPTTSKTDDPPTLRITRGDKGFRVTDGDTGVRAKCSIKGSEPFEIDVLLQYQQGMTFTAKGSTPASGGVLRISENHPNLGGALSGDCEVEYEFLNSGAVWARFTCDALSSDQRSCAAYGTFIFENCD